MHFTCMSTSCMHLSITEFSLCRSLKYVCLDCTGILMQHVYNTSTTCTCTCVCIEMYTALYSNSDVRTLQGIGCQFDCQVIGALQLTIQYEVLQLKVVQVSVTQWVMTITINNTHYTSMWEWNTMGNDHSFTNTSTGELTTKSLLIW